jgi:hypothetical protein
LRLNFYISHCCAAHLLTCSLSLNFATTRSVSQSAPLTNCISSIRVCHLVSINVWSIWLWVLPSGDFQVYLRIFRCGNIVFLTTRFLDFETFATLTTLSLIFSYKL